MINSKKKIRWTDAKSRRGIATVECAIIAPFLIFLILAAVDMGQYANVYQKICDASREGARTLVNARLSWLSSNSQWEVSAWVQNLTDEDYRIYAFDLTGALGYVQEVYTSPRWYGIGVGYSF